jgi:hypothetical protein
LDGFLLVTIECADFLESMMQRRDQVQAVTCAQEYVSRKRQIQLACRAYNEAANRHPGPKFGSFIPVELACRSLKLFRGPFPLAHPAMKDAHQFNARKLAGYHCVFAVQSES